MRTWRFWLGIIISVIFLYLAFNKVNLQQMFGAFRTVQVWYIIGAVVIYLIGLWIRAYRWKFLVDPIKLIPNTRLFPVLIIGYMANNIFPLRMGDVYRAYILGRKENISKSAALATIVVERIFDGLSMIIFLVVGLLALQSHPLFTPQEQTIIWMVTIILLTILFFFILMIWKRDFAEPMFHGVSRFLPARLGSKCQQWSSAFLDGLTVLKSGTVASIVLGLSIVSWLIEAVMYLLIGYGMQLAVPYHAGPIILAVSNLGMIIPSSPGAIGTFEYFFARSAALFALDSTGALSYAILVHALWWFPITILGFIYMAREHISFAMRSTEE
ncbi:MAG: flippase-like domain-containing protein [bacterium]|nr:flippase-like domain-containing protein [bacterium]